MKETIFTSQAPEAVGPYSQGIRFGNLIFTSGQIPLEPETGQLAGSDIQTQTRRTLKNLEAVLKEAGSSLDKVIKTTVYLTDLWNFSQVNQIYAEFFKENPPARSCVEVSALPKEAKIEIEAVAYI